MCCKYKTINYLYETIEKNKNKNIMRNSNTTALSIAISATKSILGINVDSSKTTLIELVALLNKEKSLYYGMQKFQSEKGDFEKAMKYDDIYWDLQRVCSKLNPIFKD